MTLNVFTEELRASMSKSLKKSIVCILTAGQGTRMGALGKKINKSLLPFKGQAILSHIINQFDATTEFIIALGFLGDQVQNYLKIAHPKLNVRFVNVSKWRGRGSGPGTSLLACENELKEAFHLFVCDGIWDFSEKIFSTNTLDVAVCPGDPANYCNILGEDGHVSKIYDKEIPPKVKEFYSFTGHAFIKDYKVFFNAIKGSIKLVQGECQLIDGFYPLIKKKKLRLNVIKWTDLGTLKQYQKAMAESSAYDFSKTDEMFYHTGSTIIKFFIDERLTRDRYERAMQNPSIFPAKLNIAGQFYGYQYQRGQTFYEAGTPTSFLNFLDWAHKNLWIKKTFPEESFEMLCEKFYQTKSLERIELYHRHYKDDDKISSINSRLIPPLKKVLTTIDWRKINQGIPSFFHGDLQFDNIIMEKNKFTMIDWRQNFAGSIDVGDKYYDLAKLLGGIWLQYDLIKKGLFWLRTENDSVQYDFAQRASAKEMEVLLKKYVDDNKLDWKKIKTITGLIYLNMAPLHHDPFSRLLFFLGKDILWGIHINEN